jgi:hypothetical protein
MSEDDLDFPLGIRIIGVLWFFLGSIYSLAGLLGLFFAVGNLLSTLTEPVLPFGYFIIAFIATFILAVAFVSFYVGIGFWRLNSKVWKISLVFSGLPILFLFPLASSFYGGEPWAFLVLLLLLHLSLLLGAFLVRDQFLPSQLICPNCRTMIPVGNFCQNCGTKGEIQVPTPIAPIDNNNYNEDD